MDKYLVLYIDIIFLQNLVINYLILMVTAKFSKCRTSNLRLFLGAFLGASYVALLILLPGIKAYYTTGSKVALSLLMVAVVFSPEKFFTFFKTLAIFYFSTFLFGGAAFAFLYFNRSGGFIRNGVVGVFLESKWSLLFFSVLTTVIIVRIFLELVQYRLAKENLLITLKIAFESKSIDLEALVDTGNSLHDPLTNLPVVVAEFKAIRELLPEEIRNIFEEDRENDLTRVTHIVSNSSWFSRFRLIPFTSLGKENGMLIGFKPDYIEIGDNAAKKGINDVIVGIYNKSLSRNEKYKALLSPELVA